MRKLVYVFMFLVVACNSEDVNDCFQTSGALIEEEVAVPSFESILVNKGIELIIKEAPDYKVTVSTGENLFNDVSVIVVDNQLILTDHNNCNFVRDYGITKVYVEAPNLTELRSSSQYDISSDGVLSYDELTLLSEDFNVDSAFTVGDFRLSVNADRVSIFSNNISFFYLDGVVNNLFIGFYSGVGRFEGASLVSQHISVYHRSSNDMVVYPIQSLTGELRGTGDLRSVNQPPLVNVERLYSGQLIFD